MNGDEQKNDNGVDITNSQLLVFFTAIFFRKTSYFTIIFLSENVLLMW